MFNFFRRKKVNLSTIEPIVSQKYGIIFKCREIFNGYDYIAEVPWKDGKILFYLESGSKKSFSIDKALAYFEKMFENFTWWDETIKQKFVEGIFDGKEIANIPNWSEWNAEDEDSWHIKMTKKEFYNLVQIDTIQIKKDGKIRVDVRLDGDRELVSPDGMWILTEITGTNFAVDID